MEFERLLELVGDGPVFETALLLAGKANPNIVRQQLNPWTKAGGSATIFAATCVPFAANWRDRVLG